MRAKLHICSKLLQAGQVLGLIIVLLCIVEPAAGQNTKGDRPETKGSSIKKENKGFFKKKGKKQRPEYRGSRVRGASKAASARKPDKASKASRNIYPQRSYSKKPSGNARETQRVGRSAFSRPRVKTKNRMVNNSNVYPQYTRYSQNNSKKPRPNENVVSNRPIIAKLKRQQHQPNTGGSQGRVAPRSASRPYVGKKSINVYANFNRPKRKSERANTNDLAGHPLRRRNYESPRPSYSGFPQKSPSYGRTKRGDTPYSGAKRNFRTISTSRPKSKAWQGDIAGRKLRKNYTGKTPEVGTPIGPTRGANKSFGDRPYSAKIPGGGYRSATGQNKANGVPVQRRAPGIGALNIGRYKGDLKQRKQLKGGGSVSGTLWNNKETPLARRPLSTSGKKVQGFPGKIRRFEQSPGFVDQGGGYTGNIKTVRPEKGGGSVSGKLWNNKETPIAGRAPAASARQVDGFPGKITRFEQNPGFVDQGGRYTGDVKRTWKYVRSPSSSKEALKIREPGRAFAKVSDFQGNYKLQKFNLLNSDRDLMASFKLWWARIFKKEEDIPDDLKDKGRKPRYDKGEEGLWYD